MEDLEQLIDIEKAEFIKHCRIKEEFSYRGVAAECAEVWGKSWGENQWIGEELCAVAMRVLNEKLEDGWH